MRLFQDFLDQSKQLHQAQQKIELFYHPPKDKYKIIHQKLVLPNLPAPLHYLNFFSLVGQPNSTVFCNQDAIKTTALDTATVLVSSSPHQVGQLNSYSIKKQCALKLDKDQNVHFNFTEKVQVFGRLPHFTLWQEDEELSFELKIETLPFISHFIHLKFGFAEHWSLLAHCKGLIRYKNQQFEIQQMGAFEYARLVNFPYLPYALYVYQLIQLNDGRQFIFLHSRDQQNKILYSRLYLRDLSRQQVKMWDRGVYFNIHRVFPKVKTANQQEMYLPREFEWKHADQEIQINIQAQSRGDYKFGLGAGYVGSFSFQMTINGEPFYGENGYIEYIDCRPLKWQEIDQDHQILEKVQNSVPIMLKK